jgi:ankyrin repeat protein
LLIAAGANVNRTDHRCWTPLHAAIEGDQVETVRLLLSHGAQTDLAYDFNRGRGPETPLQVAQRMGHMEIVQLLQAAVAK